jgi:hypothetical protein
MCRICVVWLMNVWDHDPGPSIFELMFGRRLVWCGCSVYYRRAEALTLFVSDRIRALGTLGLVATKIPRVSMRAGSATFWRLPWRYVLARPF